MLVKLTWPASPSSSTTQLAKPRVPEKVWLQERQQELRKYDIVIHTVPRYERFTFGDEFLEKASFDKEFHVGSLGCLLRLGSAAADSFAWVRNFFERLSAIPNVITKTISFTALHVYDLPLLTTNTGLQADLINPFSELLPQ